MICFFFYYIKQIYCELYKHIYYYFKNVYVICTCLLLLFTFEKKKKITLSLYIDICIYKKTKNLEAKGIFMCVNEQYNAKLLNMSYYKRKKSSWFMWVLKFFAFLNNIYHHYMSH